MNQPKVVDYDDWWRYQVLVALPRWKPGTKETAYTDGHVDWPLTPGELYRRLDHLTSLQAHS